MVGAKKALEEGQKQAEMRLQHDSSQYLGRYDQQGVLRKCPTLEIAVKCRNRKRPPICVWVKYKTSIASHRNYDLAYRKSETISYLIHSLFEKL